MQSGERAGLPVLFTLLLLAQPCITASSGAMLTHSAAAGALKSAHAVRVGKGCWFTESSALVWCCNLVAHQLTRVAAMLLCFIDSVRSLPKPMQECETMASQARGPTNGISAAYTPLQTMPRSVLV